MRFRQRSSRKPERSQTGTSTMSSPTRARPALGTVSPTPHAPQHQLNPARLVLVAGQALAPLILNDIEGIVNASNPVKLAITAIAYKPFLSLFNTTGVAAANPQLAGIGESRPVRPRSVTLTSRRQSTMPPRSRSRSASRVRANP